MHALYDIQRVCARPFLEHKTDRASRQHVGPGPTVIRGGDGDSHIRLKAVAVVLLYTCGRSQYGMQLLVRTCHYLFSNFFARISNFMNRVLILLKLINICIY
ncbi:hypothetical protein Patl1_31704 [Pistacia atlantica]|uniref:Uncharacterized protein n=1 Tax=Pistacia atlantica TaxID=434234 RepID=A0ACC1AQ76_9ROSI|nr:hypothetical protein Patl1_31704 [Pistacia atlantica]